MEFVNFLPWNESEKARLSWYWISIQGQLVCGKKKLLRNTCIQWNIHSFWNILVYNLKPHHCQITQCLCRRPKAGSIRSLTKYRSAVFEWSWRRRERNWKIFDSLWGREKRLISAPKRKRAVMFCVMSWKTRRGPGAAVYSFPYKQTSENKQFHPTEKEMGQWDKKRGQTGVTEEWHLWQRALRDKLQ